MALSLQQIRDELLPRVIANLYGDSSPEADERSIDLLKSWLTPNQRDQFDRMKKFSVRGSQSGDIYWITDGRASYNVVRVDPVTKVGTRRYCFVPDDLRAKGDVMLAQKILLETNEPEALRIANNYDVKPGSATAMEQWAFAGQAPVFMAGAANGQATFEVGD